MEVLAKKIKDSSKTQNLKEHTFWVVDEAMKMIDDISINIVSEISGWSILKIKELIFFSAYFHDMGKSTQEFQKTILEGSQSTHALYSASLLVGIEDFEFEEENTYINLLLMVVVTHHSLFHRGLYSDKSRKFHFLEGTKEFFMAYKISYKKYFNKTSPYKFKYQIDKNIVDEIDNIKEDLVAIKQNDKLRLLYSYVSGILNLADWLASARFSNTLPHVNFKKLPTRQSFLEAVTFEKLQNFQEKLSVIKGSVVLEIPTGEGKTEGSLLWAINQLHNKNTKIIYTLPTQTTSNKLYERVTNIFGEDRCGLIHSSAKVYLEKHYETDIGEIDDKFYSDFLLQKTFNKPITVATIDSLLKYFINIGRFNITTKNFLNSVVIIDEIHAYDLKLMGFLKRFFEVCIQLNVQVCLMSASIPNEVKKLLKINNYPQLTEPKLFKKYANEIIKKEIPLDDDLEYIFDTYKTGKNVLIIRNTIKSATEIYKKLSQFQDVDIMLYHSSFKKRDRAKKEIQIFEKLASGKSFILVATQVVEISLDIDFDIMFTDNAPMDALIQRFGRVNRKKEEKKRGKIYIYKDQISLPYDTSILELTFKTIENGYFPISKYVAWLNIVYDELYKNDIKLSNQINSIFEDGYRKYDSTNKRLNGIEKSFEPYDLRDITLAKNDYLLYDDYMNDCRSYEYTISLPVYLEKGNTYETSHNENEFYKVLDLEYSYEKGVLIEKEDNFSFGI